MEEQLERQEAVALLTLLYWQPGKASWETLANRVQLEGSAIAYLDEARADCGTLIEPDELTSARERAESDLDRWHELKLDFIPILSDRYPRQLAAVFDAPPFLFARGEVIPDDRGMSVVGSRRMTSTGAKMARDAVQVLAERDISVVAGLASGIDTVAHQEALTLGVRTVAVIGTGINQYFPPENRSLQDEIARHGLVLSQFLPDSPPSKQSFPIRNGTMSGYGLATIVVEAGERSGTRIQARKAANHGRPVILSGSVVDNTEWGRELADTPWNYVVHSHTELVEAVDAVLSIPRLIERELSLASK